ncbi:MAG: NAD(P)H-dependent oxidoreductase subunit E [Candidatus Fermentibacteraceae bacterium]|nr:NAD(P)H-dependent oxidoreductase subunit E [Candidatus Fermentibacteraceae bacterium]
MQTNYPVDSIIDRWNADPDFVIEMFQDIQDKFRFIPQEALNRVAERTGKPRGVLFHIATFYKAFSLEEKGRQEIQICMGTACYVKGAPNILAAFERELKIKSGETTADRMFTLSEVRCVGACGLAPVVVVGDDVIGGVTPSMATEIVKKYSKEG